MHKHARNGTRITVERISVTTVRTRNRSQKHYCDVCRREIESADLVAVPQIEHEQIETPELPAAFDRTHKNNWCNEIGEVIK